MKRLAAQAANGPLPGGTTGPGRNRTGVGARGLAILPLLALVLAAGCGGGDTTLPPPPTKLTAANFEKVQVGMSKVEVIILLGKWMQTTTSTGQPINGPDPAKIRCLWKEGAKHISVDFDDGKVVAKNAEGLETSP